MIDDRLVLWNHFTDEGEVSPGGKEVADDPAVIKLCASAFEAVWERGIDHDQYLI